MAKAKKEIWDVDGIQLPIYIYRERRYDNRISITKKGVNIRVPSVCAALMDSSYRSWALKWLKKQLIDRPDIASRFSSAHYIDGYLIETPYRTYVLQIKKSSRSTSVGRLSGDIIKVDLNDTLSDLGYRKTIHTLISRTIGKDQLERVTKRIHKINDHYFGQEINKVRIKNNSSNWGSCSTNANINISSKTLLAPYVVQDYIFVHELSHRIEMNHSPRYWSIVKKVMPSYNNHERWLKENGHTCEF